MFIAAYSFTYGEKMRERHTYTYSYEHIQFWCLSRIQTPLRLCVCEYVVTLWFSTWKSYRTYLFFLLALYAMRTNGVFHTLVRIHANIRTQIHFNAYVESIKKQTNWREKTRRRQRMRVKSNECMYEWVNEMDCWKGRGSFTVKESNTTNKIHRSIGRRSFNPFSTVRTTQR